MKVQKPKYTRIKSRTNAKFQKVYYIQWCFSFWDRLLGNWHSNKFEYKTFEKAESKLNMYSRMLIEKK